MTHDPNVLQQVVLALRAGAHRDVAATWAGITEAVLNDWMVDPLVKRAVEQAEANAEISLLQGIRKAAEEDPKAALAILERRFKRRWAPKTPAVKIALSPADPRPPRALPGGR